MRFLGVEISIGCDILKYSGDTPGTDLPRLKLENEQRRRVFEIGVEAFKEKDEKIKELLAENDAIRRKLYEGHQKPFVIYKREKKERVRRRLNYLIVRGVHRKDTEVVLGRNPSMLIKRAREVKRDWKAKHGVLQCFRRDCLASTLF